MSLADFFAAHRFSQALVQDFVVPLGAAIWSSPDQGIDAFPAETFLRFFKNHGFLTLRNQPRWQTVVGGSYRYVKAFLGRFEGRVELSSPVQKIVRVSRGEETDIFVHREGRAPEQFQQVVLATHADQALKLIDQPTAHERAALSAWSYSPNRTILHTDTSFLPPLRRVWSSWNYRREGGDSGCEPVSITYYMNSLQGFSSARHYCVTLNPRRAVPENRIIAEMQYTHPIYSENAVAAQGAIRARNGERSTWFCGSYMGYGFHEDAVTSALDVARGFGLSL